jgi:hypothetical protein
MAKRATFQDFKNFLEELREKSIEPNENRYIFNTTSMINGKLKNIPLTTKHHISKNNANKLCCELNLIKPIDETHDSGKRVPPTNKFVWIYPEPITDEVVQNFINKIPMKINNDIKVVNIKKYTPHESTKVKVNFYLSVIYENTKNGKYVPLKELFTFTTYTKNENGLISLVCVDIRDLDEYKLSSQFTLSFLIKLKFVDFIIENGVKKYKYARDSYNPEDAYEICFALNQIKNSYNKKNLETYNDNNTETGVNTNNTETGVNVNNDINVNNTDIINTETNDINNTNTNIDLFKIISVSNVNQKEDILNNISNALPETKNIIIYLLKLLQEREELSLSNEKKYSHILDNLVEYTDLLKNNLINQK